MLKSESEAVLRYHSGDFEVVIPGAGVRCAVTDEWISLEDLRYWSFERQEGYLNAEAATQRASAVRLCGGDEPPLSKEDKT